MIRPIVHIGYHKTASTWFQGVYYRRVENLRYVDRTLVKRAFLERGGLDFCPTRAREDLELRSSEEPVILCEEELSGHLHNGGLNGFLSAEIARRLHATLPRARIVIFIRNQPEMIAACYQQYIRGGGTHPPARYLNPRRYLYGAAGNPCRTPRFTFAHFAYLPLIQHYENLFGRASVHVIPYEEFRRDAADFLTRFAKRFELAIDLESVSLQPRNVSYSRPIILLARIMNRFTYRSVGDKRYWVNVPNWYRRRKKILEFINNKRWFGSTPAAETLFGVDQVREIEAYYRDSNRRLAEHTGLPLADFHYPL